MPKAAAPADEPVYLLCREQVRGGQISQAGVAVGRLCRSGGSQDAQCDWISPAATLGKQQILSLGMGSALHPMSVHGHLSLSMQGCSAACHTADAGK